MAAKMPPITPAIHSASGGSPSALPPPPADGAGPCGKVHTQGSLQFPPRSVQLSLPQRGVAQSGAGSQPSSQAQPLFSFSRASRMHSPWPEHAWEASFVRHWQ